ncbi:hypothetical protein [Novosphingobium mathurense]|uniref:N-acetyltransferase domain-containing protein n=1 Tax=Novosphingobium mathurense TaxID=428990 RepID=A0A1U6I6T3_9SPHN|nr:hypothetical protein [Novosphingobium mathurense]SLK03726.1 hypothetical protein SAMN06295987_104288 [Novosphingobium mathurense]
MIRLCEDPDIINRFANHPEIVSHIGGPCDFSGAMRETNVFLFGEHGGFLFEWTSPETYEVHVMITPEGRGRWGFNAAIEARDMIESLGAKRLWARISDDRPDLALFTRRAGFREVERRVLYAGDVPGEWRIFEWRSERCHQQ